MLTNVRLRVVVAILLVVGVSACAENARPPLAPSSVVVNPVAQAVDWACLTRAGAGSTGADWLVPSTPSGCGSTLMAVTAGSAPVNGAPINLRASVTGSTVRLDWDPPPGEAVTGYRLEAGSSPGLANIVGGFNLPQPFFIATNVPNGVYYVRVRGTGTPDGPPSGDVEVRVGGAAPCTPPGAPGSFRFTTSGSVITLLWDAPATGGAPAAYILDVGTSPGASNALVFDTGSTAQTFVATVPAQQFFVRVRARNACGSSGPSNEIVVGGGSNPNPNPNPNPSPATCTYSVAPMSQNVPATASSFDVTVTTQANCSWAPSSPSAFITVATPGSRTGTGAATFSVAANTGDARAFTVRITWTINGQNLGQDISVSQAEAPLPLVPNLVLRQNALTTEACNMNGGNTSSCSLDGTNSTPQSRIRGYEWRTVRYVVRDNGTNDQIVATFSGSSTVGLQLNCIGDGNIQQQFDITLTIRNAAGETASATITRSLARARCGS
jgi:hypothetical protein